MCRGDGNCDPLINPPILQPAEVELLAETMLKGRLLLERMLLRAPLLLRCRPLQTDGRGFPGRPKT